MNIIFTTLEEKSMSWRQIMEVMESYRPVADQPFGLFKPLSLDIDVFNRSDEFSEHGHITLRTEDDNAEMDHRLVKSLHEAATRAKVPFYVDDHGYALVEPGYLAKHSNGLYHGAHIGIPITHYHTNHEVTSWNVVHNVLRLLQAVLGIKLV
jgi:putative aminopeptidase FrvX